MKHVAFYVIGTFIAFTATDAKAENSENQVSQIQQMQFEEAKPSINTETTSLDSEVLSLDSVDNVDLDQLILEAEAALGSDLQQDFNSVDDIQLIDENAETVETRNSEDPAAPFLQLQFETKKPTDAIQLNEEAQIQVKSSPQSEESTQPLNIETLQESEKTQIQNKVLIENAEDQQSQAQEQKPFIEISSPVSAASEEASFLTQDNFIPKQETALVETPELSSEKLAVEPATDNIVEMSSSKEAVIVPSEVSDESALLSTPVEELTPPQVNLDKTILENTELYTPQAHVSSSDLEVQDAKQEFAPKEEAGSSFEPNTAFVLPESPIDNEISLEEKKTPLNIEMNEFLEESSIPDKIKTDAALPLEKKLSASANSSVAFEKKVAKETALAQNPSKIKQTNSQPTHSNIMIDIKAVFAGSPTIYTLLFLLSIAMIALCFYHLITLRISGVIPTQKLQELRQKIAMNDYVGASTLCYQESSFFFKIIAAGLAAKEMGTAAVAPTMKAEAKRVTVSFWQRIHFLNDIAIIAPMIGLLGTVLGMFYAFYDINRTSESVLSLFDGLGVSVGTTVAGIFVAIFAMIFHSISKYKLVQVLATAENESEELAQIMERPNSNSQPRVRDEFHT
ncbi:MAG: hypothetical protein HKM07_06180 [Chlamydiae bacterium]|nr:hypothetical protein [Chlamydiota bacterium]